jgi:hypothetical protein
MPFGLIFLKLSQHITAIVGKNSWALICEVILSTLVSQKAWDRILNVRKKVPV